MSLTFAEQLDKLLGIVEVKPTEVRELEPGYQPPTDMDSLYDALEDPPEPTTDPFAQKLEQMLKENGVDVDTELRRQYNPTLGDVQSHDWGQGREVLFSNEPIQFKCRRCGFYLEARGDQTMAEAMEEKGINPNCANAVVQSIQEA